MLGVKVRMQREDDGTLDPRTKGIPQKHSPAVNPGWLQVGVGKGLLMCYFLNSCLGFEEGEV